MRIGNRRRFVVPGVRRILVGVHGTPGSLQALRYAAAEARQRDVPLIPVIAWTPPGGELAERRQPSAYLRRIWREAAWQRMWAAFDAGLGGVPGDIEVLPEVVRGDPGPVLTELACQPDDLLVIGTGRRSRLGRRLRRSASRYCLANATCPVLAVPPSALMDEMGRGLWQRSHIRRHVRLPETVPYRE
jgi:nucleotide-binding universal stress UspA family protein